MKIYNTLTRKKEKLSTIEQGKVKIYACGPTVYNLIHIGNARPICVFDTLRRYLIYCGYKVEFVQNFTDVDDKIIKRANEEGISVFDISERYIKEYQKDACGLNVLDATVHPKVTENMDAIIDLVNSLIDKGYAYEAAGDVYFRTAKFKDYGKLSHMPLEELEAGARVEVNSVKESSMDFALWKASKSGEPFWDSPWGKGRPGWHIECSAMAKRFLGSSIDIHCGGQDLIFPHHENEIAQSECANGVMFSRYWMHNGYININNKKMSKSLNNFFTTRQVAEKYGYEAIRLLMLQAHYRSQINYTDEVIESCVSALNRLYNCRDNLVFAMQNSKHGLLSSEKANIIDHYKSDFITAMDDDLNTADAISAIFEMVREINSNLQGEKPECCEYAEYAKEVFDELCGVLGLLYSQKKSEIPQEILDLAEQRTAARSEKNWAFADSIRDQINELGYILEETRQGVKISKKA